MPSLICDVPVCIFIQNEEEECEKPTSSDKVKTLPTWKNTIPRLHTSALREYGSLAWTSGAIKSSLPATPCSFGKSSWTLIDSPKSIYLIVLFSRETRILSCEQTKPLKPKALCDQSKQDQHTGQMSRCMTPSLWMCWRPRAS